MPSHLECYYAMVALANRMDFWHRDLLTIGEACKDSADPKVQLQMTLRARPESLVRDYEAFFRIPPQEWLGPNNDPMTDEYQQFRRAALNIAAKAKRIAELKGNRLSAPGDFNMT